MKNGLSRAASKSARFICSWAFLKFVLFVLTLIVLLYAEEDWRGARIWTATKAKWEARGVSFDFNTYLPPPVPDEQNLIALPIFKMETDTDPHSPEYGTRVPLALRRGYHTGFNDDTDKYPLRLGDWQNGKLPDMEKVHRAIVALYGATFPGQPVPPDSLTAYATMHPFLAQLRTDSATRPLCRFEDFSPFDAPSASNLSLITAQIGVSKCLTDDAVLALEDQKPDQALADIRLNTQIVRGLADQPVLVSGLVSIGMVAINFGAVYDGLATHAWNDAQLAGIESDLARIDFLRQYQQALRGEAIGFAIPEIERIKASSKQDTFDPKTGQPVKQSTALGWPRGWLDIWEAQACDFDLSAADWVDRESRLFLPQALAEHQAQTQKKLDSWMIYLPWNWLFRLSADGSAYKELNKFAQMQVWVDEARVACALERYRLAHNAYPATLDVLLPICIDQLPHDVMNGQPYHYHLRADGTFLLYSVGWNQKDDGGKRAMKQDNPNAQDYTQGDWPWPMPTR